VLFLEELTVPLLKKHLSFSPLAEGQDVRHDHLSSQEHYVPLGSVSALAQLLAGAGVQELAHKASPSSGRWKKEVESDTGMQGGVSSGLGVINGRSAELGSALEVSLSTCRGGGTEERTVLVRSFFSGGVAGGRGCSKTGGRGGSKE